MTLPAPSPDVRARVLEAARLEPTATRAVGARRRGLATLLGFAVMAAVAARLGVHPGARPVGYITTLEAGWLLIAVVTTWAGVARGRSMLGRPDGVKLAVAVLTPVVLLVLWGAAALTWPETTVNESGLFEIVQCLVGTALLAIGPLLAFAYLRRASDPTRPALGGAALGAASGSWGAALLIVICRHASPTHILLGHVLPVVVLIGLGAGLGAQVLALRPRTS